MADERREDEKRRRDAAQAGVAEVEPGGHEVAGRSIKQMVSARLEAQLLRDLRELAEKQGVSVSDLLRQAAVELLERSRTSPVQVRYGRAEAVPMTAGVLTAGARVSSGFFLTTGGGHQLSGNDPVDVLVGST